MTMLKYSPPVLCPISKFSDDLQILKLSLQLSTTRELDLTDEEGAYQFGDCIYNFTV